MKLRYFLPCFLFFLLFSGCTPEEDSNSTEQILSGRIGPSGELSASLADLEAQLSDLDAKDFRGQEYNIMLAMHDVNNDWSKAIIDGLEDCLANYEMHLSLITDGAFNIEKQQADLKNILQRNPDVLISLPLDTEIMAVDYGQFAQNDIPMVFVDAVPQGLRAPDDYIGWVVGDAYRMGYLGAQVLAESLEPGSEVALLHWGNSMFTVDERSIGARDYLAEQNRVTLVEELYFQEFHEIEELTRAMMEEHPGIAGLWTVWDTPGFEAMDALKEIAPHVKVSSCDLSRELADEIDSGEMVVGSGVDHPYDLGCALGLLALAAIKEIELDNSYFVIYAEKAHGENWEEVWQRMYHSTR